MADFVNTTLNMVRESADLSQRQLGILFLAHERDDQESRQVKELAIALNVAKPVITRATDALAELQLVKREKLPLDRRSCVITLTKTGNEFVARMLEGFPKAAPRRKSR